MDAQFPVLGALDRRLNAHRPDLADIRLAGRVEAARFVEGRPAHVGAALVDLRREPRPDCGVDTQLLRGEDVLVFDETDGWAWVQSAFDGYVGWTSAGALSPGRSRATHEVRAPRTFAYPGPDLKFPHLDALSMGSRVEVTGEAETRGTRYALLAGGEAVIARHLRPLGETDRDYVAVAEEFLWTPYLWGGTSGFGLDCSGLVHLAMRMCGVAVLRDSDMQAATIGDPFDPGREYENLRRGDLVFWRGHIAIAQGEGILLHANGYTMQVTSEPVGQALDRIERMFERPIGFRRP